MTVEQEVVVTLDGLPRPATVVDRHGDRVLVRYRQAGGFEERWVPARTVVPVEEPPTRPPLGKIVGGAVIAVLGLLLLLYPSGSDQPLLSDQPTPTATPTPSAGPTPTGTPTPAVVQAVLFGDALTAGRGNDPATPTLLEVAASRLGWRAVTRAQPKTGFTTRPSYADRLAAELTGVPDVVLVQGGASDTGATQAALTRAATRTLADLQRRLPRATIVLVGPVAMEQPPDQSLVRVDRVLRAVAQQQRITYVSPIALRWITPDNYERYVAPTSFYPNASGHAYLGARLAVVLRSARIGT